MSFDPLLVRFARLLALVFIAAVALVGLAWFMLRERKPGLVREIRLRTVAWIVIAALFVGALAAGRVAWILLVTLLSIAALREYGRAVGLWKDPSLLGVGYLSILAIQVTVWWPFTDASPELGWYGMFLVMPIYAILTILAVPIVRGVYDHMIQKLSLTILGVLYFGWLLGHFSYLHNLDDGTGLVLFLGFLVAINDIAAFVWGKLFGRHKLRATLSPGKTVEGALGSLVTVVAAAWGLSWLIPMVETTWAVLLLGGLISFAGTLGDLTLSVIKRDLGIKDWSAAIPGHGGVLDRANSLIFAVPLFFHITRFFFL